MIPVRLVAGDGLVGRTSSVLWWTCDDRLVDELMALDGSGFTAVADAIVSLDFEVGGLAAVNTGSGVAFVCGDAQLLSDGELFDGRTTATWIEGPVADAANLAVNAYASNVDDRTNLTAGQVRGGGFVLGEPALPDAPVAVATAIAEPLAQPAEASETLVFGDEAEVPTADRDDLAWKGVPLTASVEFDDGRVVEVRRGLIVGRNPEHGELPMGFSSVTVLGQFISRRHWEIDLDPAQPVVRDLGSTSGTIVELADTQTRLSPREFVGVERSFRVLFADHWAQVTVRPI